MKSSGAPIGEQGSTGDGLRNSYEESTARDEAAQAEWACSISYAADIGTFAKSRIALSKHGFDWKGERIPLNEITRCRWGGLSKSVKMSKLC